MACGRLWYFGESYPFPIPSCGRGVRHSSGRDRKARAILHQVFKPNFAMRPVSLTSTARMLLALAGFGLLLGCGSGPTVTEIPLPTVSVSPTTGSVQTGASVQFTATVVTTIS